ncbi:MULTISPECIES: metallophosphoesterase family protein [Sphingobacterium]|uniref:metallophosphoesterase family protein n=1 Tax=Sphingobacterium TaxID=28453 RepID=UPI0013D93C5E|nr:MULTISPECIES: metallophosphoesterase [unclassified Sphingobacterium]
MINRKSFIKIGTLGVSGFFLNSSLASSLNEIDHTIKKKGLKFGVITDLHYDLMHDAGERAEAFINAMNQEQPDFIISLGDFCVPKPQNQPLMDTWNKFKGEKHYVLGNHDTDGGFTKDQALRFWNINRPYYSFDKEDFHFVILDGNEKPANSKLQGYPRTIDKKQLAWLKEDLQKTNLRTVIFCHQGLDNTNNGLDNGMEVRYLFEQINQKAGFNKVILVLTGHHHSNYHNTINNIHYVQINSSSYYWVDESYKSTAFTEDFYKKHPILRHTIVYEDPIWAIVEIDGKNKIKINGKKSRFAGDDQTAPSGIADTYPITAEIDNRELSY